MENNSNNNGQPRRRFIPELIDSMQLRIRVDETVEDNDPDDTSLDDSLCALKRIQMIDALQPAQVLRMQAAGFQQTLEERSGRLAHLVLPVWRSKVEEAQSLLEVDQEEEDNAAAESGGDHSYSSIIVNVDEKEEAAAIIDEEEDEVVDGEAQFRPGPARQVSDLPVQEGSVVSPQHVFVLDTLLDIAAVAESLEQRYVSSSSSSSPGIASTSTTRPQQQQHQQGYVSIDSPESPTAHTSRDELRQVATTDAQQQRQPPPITPPPQQTRPQMEQQLDYYASRFDQFAQITKENAEMVEQAKKEMAGMAGKEERAALTSSGGLELPLREKHGNSAANNNAFQASATIEPRLTQRNGTPKRSASFGTLETIQEDAPMARDSPVNKNTTGLASTTLPTENESLEAENDALRRRIDAIEAVWFSRQPNESALDHAKRVINDTTFLSLDIISTIPTTAAALQRAHTHLIEGLETDALAKVDALIATFKATASTTQHPEEMELKREWIDTVVAKAECHRDNLALELGRLSVHKRETAVEIKEETLLEEQAEMERKRKIVKVVDACMVETLEEAKGLLQGKLQSFKDEKNAISQEIGVMKRQRRVLRKQVEDLKQQKALAEDDSAAASFVSGESID